MTKIMSIAARRIQPVSLAIIPLFLPLLAIHITNEIGSFDGDPDYAYLLNALNVLYLHAPRLDSHPGTPVTMISAVIMGVLWLGRLSWTGLTAERDVLLHPETYLYCISFVFAVLSAGAIYFFGWRLRWVTGSITVAIVGQLSFLLSMHRVTIGLQHADPESLLIGLTILLAAIQAPLIFSRVPQPQARPSIMIGLMLGACLATKVTAAPLLLTILFLSGHWYRLVALLTTIISAIVFTLPISDRYYAMSQWFLSLLTHSGSYGLGPSGLPDLATLWENAQDTFESEMGFCCLIFAVLWAGRVGDRFADSADFRRLFRVTSITIATQLIMITKHPGANYFVPAVATVALGNAGVAYLVVLLEKGARQLAMTVGAICVVFGIRDAWHKSRQDIATNAGIMQGDLALIAKYKNAGCLPVYYYDAPDPEFKLVFGNIFAGGRYNRILAELYPNFLFYDQGHFQTFAGPLEPAAAKQRLAREKCVYLIGSAMERFPNGIGLPPDSLTLIARIVGHGALYEYKSPQ
jgi:hypothetical protein